MLVNTCQAVLWTWSSNTGFSSSESSRNTSSQLPKVWSRDVNPESTWASYYRLRQTDCYKGVGTCFLGFAVSYGCRTERIQCSYYYSVVSALCETYLANTLAGTRQNRERTTIWHGLCYMMSSCCLQGWADGKSEHLRGGCTFTCYQCHFCQETDILCPLMGTCMLIAFLDLCLLTCVHFHGKWVIQNYSELELKLKCLR